MVIKTSKQLRNERRRELKKNLSKMIKLAVYGNLCKTASCHNKLHDGNYVGSFDTEPLYTMYDLKYYPGVVKGGNTSIRMEVYNISPDLLQRFNKSEDVIFKKELIDSPFGYCVSYFYMNLDNWRKIPDQIICGNWVEHIINKNKLNK